MSTSLEGQGSAVAFETQSSATTNEPVNFAWLEITGGCQERCNHCYAESGPDGTQGTMTTVDWKDTIDQLAMWGTRMVQFIGGEPTLHPDLVGLIDHALRQGMEVEVFSNLVHVTPEHWKAFGQECVRLATSYYSKDPSVHQEITNSNTHNPIRRNIRRATRAGIPLRVGVIGVQEGQDINGAVSDLVALGVDPDCIGTDNLRQVGRGIRDEVSPETISQLCGNCANGVVAILPDGQVQPCVFSRQSELMIGDVQERLLLEILADERFASVRALLRSNFTADELSYELTGWRRPCAPQACNPELGSCPPNCRPSTNPCAPDAQGPCGPGSQPCNPYNCRPTCAP